MRLPTDVHYYLLSYFHCDELVCILRCNRYLFQLGVSDKQQHANQYLWMK